MAGVLGSQFSAAEIAEAARLADGAYRNGEIPAGWSPVGAGALLPPGGFPDGAKFSGSYFVAGPAWQGAPAAIVLRNGDKLAVSFRGTETISGDAFLKDVATYPAIIGSSNAYITAFTSLLTSVALYAQAEGLTDITMTGHSLGAAAVNQLRAVADDVPAFRFFENAKFIAFGTPAVRGGDILNFGFVNDTIFKVANVPLGPDRPYQSTTDNFYFAGKNFVVNGPDDKSLAAHRIERYIEAADSIAASPFARDMQRDDVIVAGGTDELVYLSDVALKGETTFFFGQREGDVVRGSHGQDRIFGFDGADRLSGRGGKDVIVGGDGNDFLSGGTEKDWLSGGTGADSFLFIASGRDRIADFESGVDRLLISADIATRLRDGALSGSRFSEEFASGRKAQMIYDLDSGRLRYDPDGTGQKKAITVFILEGAPELKASDIWIA